MLKSVLPENGAQVDIVAAFAAKRLKVEATMKLVSDETLALSDAHASK